MTPEEIKNTDFETFFQAVPQMKEVHHIKATGQEIYHVYKNDVVYVTRPEGERTLQMLVPEVKPESVQKKYPAILYVQGSAWLKQDQYKRLSAMADLARRGFVTAILQYRESNLATFPAQVQDAKTGIRFLRKHAEEYQNVMRRFLKGDEGVVTDVMYQTRKRWDLEGIYNCITAVLAGITAGQNILDTEDYNEYSCQVKAIVDFYGVTDVRQKEDFPTTLNQGEPDSPEGKLIGGNNVYEHPELSVPVTCANYVEKATPIPPILMMHGTGDDTVSWRQSVRLYKKLREEEKDVTFYIMENAVHGDNAFWTTENLNIVDEFIKKHI